MKTNTTKQFRSQRWIVLVDDEASIQDAVGQLLVQNGYQVTTCANGKEALRIALWSSRYGAPPTSSPRPPYRTMDLDFDDDDGADHTKYDEFNDDDEVAAATLPTISDITSSSSSSSTFVTPTNTETFPLTCPRYVPDVIVSDVRMPIMDGLTLLEQIRSHPQLVQIPVILLTAKSMVHDRVAGYQAGADAYLPKPFDPDELIALIDHYIQRHETLNDANQNAIVELQRNVQDMKYLLLEQLGGSSTNTLGTTDAFQPPNPTSARVVKKYQCFSATRRTSGITTTL